jgi:hypothetical protein
MELVPFKVMMMVRIIATFSVISLILSAAYVCKEGDCDKEGVLTQNAQVDAIVATTSASIYNNWTKMNPSSGPPARGDFGFAYDFSSDRGILFGGVHWPAPFLNDTWAYDYHRNAWTNMNPAAAPSARGFFDLVYDSINDRIILFGGGDPLGGGCAFNFNDTWAYDFDGNKWTNKTPNNSPSPRGDYSIVYDSRVDRTILFGGIDQDQSWLNDTWIYDFANNTWTNVTPIHSPSERHGGGMSYDAQNDRIILFGGGSDALNFNDTWSYDYKTNSWTELTPSISPSKRSSPALTYDSNNNHVILFGGSPSASQFFNDTWTYDFNANAWTNMNPSQSPTKRTAVGFTYDSRSNRALIFGGWNGGCIDETWAYVLGPNMNLGWDVTKDGFSFRNYGYLNSDFGGHCFGMADMSIRIFKDEVNIHQFDASANTTYQLQQNDGMLEWAILYYHMKQLEAWTAIRTALLPISEVVTEFDNLRNIIASGEPALLCAGSSSDLVGQKHAVVAYGLSTVDNQTYTVSIYDCNFNGTKRFVTVNIATGSFEMPGYSNFNKFIAFKVGANVGNVLLDFTNTLWVRADCPVNLTLYDSQRDSVGELLNGGETHIIILSQPLNQNYTIEILGTGNGAYNLTVVRVDDNDIIYRNSSGNITQGARISYRISITDGGLELTEVVENVALIAMIAIAVTIIVIASVLFVVLRRTKARNPPDPSPPIN